MGSPFFCNVLNFFKASSVEDNKVPSATAESKAPAPVSPKTPPKKLSEQAPDTFSRLAITPQHLQNGNSNNLSGTFACSGDLMILGDKPGGVEPGFIAVKVNKDVYDLARKYISNQFPSQSFNREDLRSYFTAHPNSAEMFITELQQNEKIKKWLIKQDYSGIGYLGQVAPPLMRLGQSGMVKKQHWIWRWLYTLGFWLYRNLTSNYSQENFNAIAECIATKIANAHGMLTQTQELIVGSYENGAPKIVTVSLWEENLETFQYRLAGDNNHEKYLVRVRRDAGGKILKDTVTQKPILLKANDYYLADNSIADLGMSLALVLAQNDRDVIGSTGQNKGQVNNSLFGFDFGQAYRRPNEVVKTLQDDFSFKQGAGTDFIKNISVFYDTAFSERMAGVICLYKITARSDLITIFTETEMTAIEAAIAQYQIELPILATRLEKISAGAEETIFESKQHKFIELAREKSNNQDQLAAQKFSEYAADIAEIETNAKNARLRILKTFRERLMLAPKEVDFLDQLEKFSSPTTILSPNGMVILNHLRIRAPNFLQKVWKKIASFLFGTPSESNRIRWSMKKDHQQIILITDSMAAKQARMLAIQLNEYLFENGRLDSVKIETKKNSNPNLAQVSFEIASADLNRVMAFFTEAKIKNYKQTKEPQYHPAAALINKNYFKIGSLGLVLNQPLKTILEEREAEENELAPDNDGDENARANPPIPFSFGATT